MEEHLSPALASPVCVECGTASHDRQYAWRRDSHSQFDPMAVDTFLLEETALRETTAMAFPSANIPETFDELSCKP